MNKLVLCVVCGFPVPSKNRYRNQRYCSWACYQAEHRAKYSNRLCLFCGKQFKVNVRSKKKYCSPECRYRASTNLGHEYAGLNGYIYIKTGPKHYQLKHRLIAEQKLRRPLKPDENCHHINGDKHDNRPENIKVFASNSAHIIYHNSLYGGKHPKDSPEAIKKRVETRKRNRLYHATV